MGLLDILGFNRLPAGLQGSSLIIMDAGQLSRARPFLDTLRQQIGNTALLLIGSERDIDCDIPHLVVADDLQVLRQRLEKIAPARIVMLGLSARHAPLLKDQKAPSVWINARESAIASAGCKRITVSHADPQLPNAEVTGDPLSGLGQLPAHGVNTDICHRFKEQREGSRWLAYFAGTGESEENMAYLLFNRAIRHKMGLMILAPRDQARCEPVYRESIKFRLQTIRHRRLSTSFVPIKTRVYYVEDPQPLADLHACADFVIAGGTMHADSTAQPDLVTPMLHGKTVIVGPAHRDQPLVASAVDAGVVLAADDENQLYDHMRTLIDQPEYGQKMAEQARNWLTSQPGAAQRVIQLISNI